MLVWNCAVLEILLNDSPQSAEPRTEKRRSTRVVQAVPIIVRGCDALSNEFQESTTTVMISCSGCKYQTRHYVPKGSEIALEIRQRDPGRFPRVVPSRVVWVQRPRSYRELFHVAVEFQIPGNVWPVDSPPGDWFPCPEDEELVVPVSEEAFARQSAAAPEENLAKAAATSAGAQATAASPLVKPKHAAGNVVSISADRAQGRETSAASAVQKPGGAAAAPAGALPGISPESLHAQVREALAAQLPAALEEKIEALIRRVRDAAVKETLERVAEHTAAKVEELRNASASAEVLDAKIRETVQQALRFQETETRKIPARRRKKIPR
ncbi:MAG: PilZ domain-containing protein [Candidatus Binataceae bacterium]